MRAMGLSFSFSLKILYRNAFFRTNASPECVLQHTFLGMPLGECLSGISLENLYLPGNASRGIPLGPAQPLLGATRNYLHDFLSPSFFPSFSNRSGTPLFRSGLRKTSQNGAQTLPKSSRKRVQNRSYVAKAEK